MEKDEKRRLLLWARGLAVLRGVLESEASQNFLALLELLAEEEPEPALVAEIFGRLWEELALEPDLLLPDAWQSHLVARILDDENPFSLGAELGGERAAVVGQARRDLATLQKLFDLDAETLLSTIEREVPDLAGVWSPWTDPRRNSKESPRRRVAHTLASAGDWAEQADSLAEHFTRHGAGDFGRCRAFLWREGGISPVGNPDPISLDQLIGYEREQELLRRNTERLLSGVPSHHALLYGLPGTGKSSTVKAIASEYADRGLRLVEVVKEDLPELPRVLDALRGRGPRFIVFIDDLSFEEREVEYKALKALLEGTVEQPPENVRVYATSNRRNLVRESFAEREEDVHARDTEQEKMSLAARFGLRVTFPTPDQSEYLEIAAGLARQRGLKIPEEELTERALLWGRWRSGRSGRTARQFVDELEAELAGS